MCNEISATDEEDTINTTKGSIDAQLNIDRIVFSDPNALHINHGLFEKYQLNPLNFGELNGLIDDDDGAAAVQYQNQGYINQLREQRGLSSSYTYDKPDVPFDDENGEESAPKSMLIKHSVDGGGYVYEIPAEKEQLADEPPVQ